MTKPAIIMVALVGGAGLMLMGASQPASSHPHVWIDNVTTFVFADGALVGLRHHWTFDDFFSSMVLEEHDADGDGALDEAESLAIRDQAFAAVAAYGYFTHVRVDGASVPLATVDDFAASAADGVLTYAFTLPLPTPIDPARVRFEVGVYDSEYYVEVLLDWDDPVRFEGVASAACTFDVREDSDNPIYYGMVDPTVVGLSCVTS